MPARESGLPYIGLEHVESQTMRLCGTGDSEALKGNARVFEPGSILYARLRPYLNKVYVPEFSGVASTEFFVFSPSDKLAPRFLAYLLNSPSVVEFANLHAEGIERPRVGWTRLAELPVMLPPLAEQRRIVATIEEQLSRLHAAERSLVRVRGIASAFRNSALKQVLAGDWPARPLSEVASIVSGQTPKGLVPYPAGPIPYFKVGDMNAAISGEMIHARFYLDDELVERFRIAVRPAGTIVFPKRGGAIATNKKRRLAQPAAFDLNTMGLIPGDEVDSRYLFAWLQTVDLRRLADGSNVPQINLPDVSPLELPLPPLSDQHGIVLIIEQQLSLIDSVLGAVGLALARAVTLRRAILECAVRGEVVPQDPDDEPASVLLERIRAERAAAPKPKRRKRLTA